MEGGYSSVVYGDVALQFIVPCTMISRLFSIPGLRRIFFHPTIFHRSTMISDRSRLRLALRGHGLRRLLRRADYF